MNLLEQRSENSGVSRVTGPLRRFGENMAVQVRLRAKYGAAIAATLATVVQAPALAGGRSFMGDVGNAEEPPAASEPALAESQQSEIPLEFPPLVPVGPKSSARAGGNLYLIRPDGKEENILGPSILSLKTDPCVDCVVELRCQGPKVREELDPPPQIFRVQKGEGKKKRRVIKVEETLVAKVTALRGKTTTFGCAGENFEDPESPGGWQVFVPTLETPPVPPEEVVSESTSLPAIEAIPQPSPTAPVSPVPSLPTPPVSTETISTAETVVSEKRWAMEAGATFPTASTDNLFPREPGAFARARRKFGSHIGASAGVSWNPVRQGLTRRHEQFTPLNHGQHLRGNAFRVTAGPFATGRVPLSNLVHIDFHAGINMGVNVSSVGRKRDVAVDRDGQLADIPHQNLAVPVAEMCGSVSFGVRERLSGVFGLCTGTSLGRAQTTAADPKGEVLTFVEPMAGARVEF